jgi:hypothetical protein
MGYCILRQVRVDGGGGFRACKKHRAVIFLFCFVSFRVSVKAGWGGQFLVSVSLCDVSPVRFALLVPPFLPRPQLM